MMPRKATREPPSPPPPSLPAPPSPPTPILLMRLHMALVDVGTGARMRSKALWKSPCPSFFVSSTPPSSSSSSSSLTIPEGSGRGPGAAEGRPWECRFCRRLPPARRGSRRRPPPCRRRRRLRTRHPVPVVVRSDRLSDPTRRRRLVPRRAASPRTGDARRSRTPDPSSSQTWRTRRGGCCVGPPACRADARAPRTR